MKQYEFYKQLRYLEDSWLQENQDTYKNYLKFIWNKFLNTPKLLKYLNNYINDYSWAQFSPYEQAKFIKELMNQHNISHSQLYDEWPDKESKNRSILKDKLKKEYGGHDIDNLWALWRLGIIENPFEEFQEEKKALKLTKEVKEQITRELAKQESENDDMFLKELSQEIIDELDLTLFDVSILKSKNKILYIFIDKDSKKRFYEAPFEFQFLFDTRTSIVEKEYFEDMNQPHFHPYRIKKYSHYQEIKRLINRNFEHEINLGGL